MCGKQKSCCYLKVQGHRPYLEFVHMVQSEPVISSFVLHDGISKLHGKTFVIREDHVASLKVKIII